MPVLGSGTEHDRHLLPHRCRVLPLAWSSCRPHSPACTAPASGPTLLLSVGTTPPPSTASEFSEFARSPGRLSSTPGLRGTAGVAEEEEREISTGEQREGDRARLSKEGRRNAKQCKMHHPTSLAET